MKRRKFLKFLGVGSAAVAVAPALLADVGPAPVAIGEYYSYTNFSAFAITEDYDEMVLNTAAELGRLAGEDIVRLQNLAFS